jgi:K+-sensing histidine kinase KdpD
MPGIECFTARSVSCLLLNHSFFIIYIIMANKYNFSERVRTNVLFQAVEEPILQTILGTLNELKFEDGDIIFEDDSEGNCVFLVLSGSVKIAKHLRTGEEIVLGILHEHDFFGELDLIDQRRRSAQATAVGECTLGKLAKREFDYLLKSSSTFVLNLLHMVTLRLRTNNLIYVLDQESNLVALRQQLTKTHQLVEASKIVNSSLNIDELLELIFQTAARTVGADRGTLYLFDEPKKELWSKVQKGSSRIEIRLPIGVGIAGTVAATGETINIPDAYSDSRFNPDIDQLTGYHTKATLCMPMKNRDGKIIGVFQLLNKFKGSFTHEDEEFIEAFSVHAALAIENGQLALRMIQNERLSAVGRMASTIIHDIKNPMHVLRLSAEIIKTRTENEETTKFAAEMIQQIDHFIAMTQEILDFARGISSTNFEEVNFGEVMEAMTALIEKNMIRRGIKFTKKLKFSETIRIDQEKLLRVFYNITGNAADAMEKGGELIVNTFKDDENLIIEFIDNGCGMSKEIKAKIFEPFFTHGKKHGTGLGMSIVKKIMDDHNGSIAIESTVDKGTTVRLSLPLK